MKENSLVLVTGATGYLASHVILQLVEKNCKIRGTVRSLDAEENQALLSLAKDPKQIELVEANLLKKEDWNKVMEGVDYLLHIASPCSIVEPKDPNTII